MHREKQRFLNVYVDDFHMAGKKANLAPMWAKLREHINLDPPTPFNKGSYLGCTQHDVPIDRKMIEAKCDAVLEMLVASQPDLAKELGPPWIPSRPEQSSRLPPMMKWDSQ